MEEIDFLLLNNYQPQCQLAIRIRKRKTHLQLANTRKHVYHRVKIIQGI